MRGIVAMLAVVFTAACGAPTDLSSQGAPVPQVSADPPTSNAPPSLTRRPVPSATYTPWPEYTAVDCAGRPTKDQVAEVVRRDTNIDPGAVIAGPLCAGTWQYTVFAVPERDPVQVLTKTTATGLDLVAAGTDVCSLDIEHQAPSGIYAAANC